MLDLMAFRRYRAPAGASGHSLTPVARTLSGDLDAGDIRRLIELTDQWAKEIGVMVVKSANSTIRKRVKSKKVPSLVMGIHMPTALADEIAGTEANNYEDGLAYKHDRSVSSILGWCVAEGVKKLTLDILLEAYPDTRPSLNLTSLMALGIGLKKFKRVFPVSEAPASEKVVATVINRSAETQRISQHWSKTRRAQIARQLRRKARAQEDERRGAALKILATMVQEESPEFLEKMRVAIEAELGSGAN